MLQFSAATRRRGILKKRQRKDAVLMESILNLFTLLLHLLPGLVLIRRRDWSGAVFCMALGILWVLEGLGLRWGLGRSLLSVLFLLFTLLWAAPRRRARHPSSCGSQGRASHRQK